MVWVFLLGFLSGILAVAVVGYIILFNAFGKPTPLPPFIDQFQPLKVPQELKNFLRSHPDEHKDTRKFRRWVYKKLQLELNDVTTRSAAGRIISGIQIRDLSVGNEFPLIKNIRVERFQMSEDREFFEELSFVVDVDYRGGFQTSVDVNMIFGRFAHLSIKVLRLAGKARIVLTRHPYAHWCFSFIEMPELDFKVESQFQGKQLKRMIPLITQAFRKTLQRKHVWPNYKIRYRPLLPNPFLQPSPPPSAFEHVEVTGKGLEVTILQCTRLNTKLVQSDENSSPYEVYCSISLDQRPFTGNTKADSIHCMSVMLNFSRKGPSDSIGLTFSKNKVIAVETGSTADKCGFKEGDTLLAINNVPIRNERQAMRMLSGTAGELIVLVERDLDHYMEEQEEFEEEEVLMDDGREEFVCVGTTKKKNHSTMKPCTLKIGASSSHHLLSTNVEHESERHARASSMCSSESPQPETPVKKEPISELSSSLPMRASFPVDLGDKGKSTPNSNVDKTEIINRESGELDHENERDRRQSSTPMSPFSLNTTATSPSARSEQEIDNEIAFDFPAEKINEQSLEEIVDKCGDCLTRTRSVRVPKLSIQQPSADLRRSRSESELFIANEPENDDVENSNINVDEELVARLNEDNLDEGEFEDAPIDPDDPSSTIRASVRNILASEEVPRDDKLDTSAPNENMGSPKVASRRERFQARANEMATKLHAGKSKVNDFFWRRTSHNKDLSPRSSFRSPSATAFAELAAESEDNCHTEEHGNNGSPLPPSHDVNQTAPAEVNVMDKSANVLWGQSLHFGLEKRVTRYLNVTVHARKKQSDSIPTGDLGSTIGGEVARPILLGHTSVYIPQVVDDCQLTLANCHREVFQLRPPPKYDDSEHPAEFADLARHTGFDSRLCYGDITLSFRFFPQGLPQSSIRVGTPDNQEQSTSGELHVEPTESHPLQSGRISPFDQTRNSTRPQTLYDHKWVPIQFKHGSLHCSTCTGRIWLKSGSRCSVCNIICHDKCQDKANRQHECIPDPTMARFDDDAHFEVLDGSDLGDSAIGSAMDTLPTIDLASSVDTDSIASSMQSRRRRIANKVSEKLTNTWKNVGAPRMRKISKQQSPTGNEGIMGPYDSVGYSGQTTEYQESKAATSSQQDSPEIPQLVSIAEILQKYFPDLHLQGSPLLSALLFEPGNAYNAEVISEAKACGKLVFDHLSDIEERKRRINEQIDEIQSRITYLANLRRTIVDKSGEEFESIDVRREALALLMLHYCTGLTECMDKEEQLEKQNVKGSPQKKPEQQTPE
ncbi:PDZ domain-containing protein 8 [Ditylenchus destructor]|uniref:PDZ domain-containing protein 8 n=1 Tax=Ditylenchus destructor TaxID=166010 RepID=A0AAD4N584_9BILA|nr:PDZ domain-containing protein 8 [Ditylenchus destructor]